MPSLYICRSGYFWGPFFLAVKISETTRFFTPSHYACPLHVWKVIILKRFFCRLLLNILTFCLIIIRPNITYQLLKTLKLLLPVASPMEQITKQNREIGNFFSPLVSVTLRWWGEGCLHNYRLLSLSFCKSHYKAGTRRGMDRIRI